MRQLLQNVSSGNLSLEEVPAPMPDRHSLLIATHASLISAGTERAVVELGNRSLVGKARARPDLVAKVIENARAEGIGTTLAKVRGRLSEPNPLGYSLAGVVIHACEGSDAAPGDLVAAAGAGRANHAEIVSVPKHLCARVPEGVTAEDAAYGTVATIALHGFRLAKAGIGDVVAVVGLGLVGQLALEIAAAAGCVAIGFDPAADRAELARGAGLLAESTPEGFQAEVMRRTRQRGADAVLITAASASPQPLATAVAVARERAIVAVVGDVPINSPRTPLFAKELQLVVSRSYGPGRYDPAYEERGHDYPAGYVRWTEGRNLEEVLRLMAAGRLTPSRLTSHRFELDRAVDAYALLSSDEPSLGIILCYPGSPDRTSTLRFGSPKRRARVGAQVRLGVIGAGAFARSVLMPHLRNGASIVGVANATGASARSVATREAAELATTDPEQLLADESIDAVVIATRHDTHAPYVIRALEAGKHVFVEKPLALSLDELDAVEQASANCSQVLMVGFNRRYAPLAEQLKAAIGARGPLIINYRVNAGRLPASHWTHDPEIGGGRIVGEVCHFVDFATYLAGAVPMELTAVAAADTSELREDNLLAVLRHADGSIASISYTAFGDPGMSKERIEVFGEAGAATLDDFRQLDLFQGGKRRTQQAKRDKGHGEEIQRFLRACRTGTAPQALSEVLAVTRATLQLRERITRPL